MSGEIDAVQSQPAGDPPQPAADQSQPAAEPTSPAAEQATPPPSSGGPKIVDKPPPKPSGLRPPSKIGRLCSSHCAPKPAIPASPNKNDPNLDAMRKISDDYSRKYLADVQEADEETDSFTEGRSSLTPSKERKPSTCSTYSITSMEALWEKDPRKLSEAGLRRSSDHSIVLTEDTDGFIIGDRVYVGGSKPGQIAYIGDTQFAPGEWAGVVLEEPIGKNDGSVAGVRYFQCEPKKGVFSRLTRLTREPLPGAASPSSPSSERGSSVLSNIERPSSAAAMTTNGSGLRPPASPGSVTSIPRPRQQRSVSPNGSMRSVTSRMSTATQSGELRLGERVIVSSSQGSKAGTLRYIGPTEFANGQWCGVELDDPIGKNDGSVEGKRYFECGPRFGLFAPLAKVSRSPSNRRPGACAVHGRGSSPPDSMASSMISTNTTTGRPRMGVGSQRLSGPRAVSTPMSAKNTLQELLREKQQHIERLMVELDTEKIELTKVCQKADALQNNLEAVRSENMKITGEVETLKSERDTIVRQLEDERQKVEDLTFRAEEDNIHKEDFCKIKEELLNTKETQSAVIAKLQAEIVAVKSQLEELQVQNDLLSAQHKAETDVLISQHKDEIKANQVLSSDLQSLLDEAHALLKEKNLEKETLTKSHFDEVTKVKVEFKTQLSETSNTVSELKSQLQEYTQSLEASREAENSYKKEIERLKMDFGSRNMEYETTVEMKTKIEGQLQSLQTEMAETNSKLSNKEKELNALLEATSKDQSSSQHEIVILREQLNNKELDLNKLSQEKSSLEADLQKNITEYTEYKEKSAIEYSNMAKKYEAYENDVKQLTASKDEEFAKSLQEKDAKFNDILESQKNGLHEEFEQQKSVLSNEINKHLIEIQNISQQNVQLQTKVDEFSKTNAEISSKMSSIQSANEDLQRRLKDQIISHDEIVQQKEKLEKEIADLTNNSSNSNEQLSILSNKLRETENEFQNSKTEHRRKEDEYHRQIEKLIKELEQQKLEMNEKIASFEEQSKSKIGQIQSYEEQVKILNNTISEMQENLNKVSSLLKEKEASFEIEKSALLEASQTSSNRIVELEKQVDNFKHSIESSETAVNEMMNELLKAKETLTSQLAESRNNEQSLKDSINQINQEFKKTNDDLKSNMEAELQKRNDKEKIFQDDVVKLQNTIDGLQKNIQDKEISMQELQQKNVELESQFKTTLEEKVSIENKCTSLQQNLATSESTFSEQQNILNELMKRLATINPEDSLKDQQQANISMIYDSIEKVKSYKEKASCLENEISKLKTGHSEEINNLVSNNSNLDKLVNELKTQLTGSNEKCQLLQAKIDATESEMKKFVSSSTEDKAKHELLYKKELEDMSEKLQEKIKLLESQVAEKNRDLQKEENCRKDLQSKLESTENKIPPLEVQIKNLMEEQNNAKLAETKNIEKSSEELKNAKIEISKLNDIIKQHESHNEKMKNEIVILNGKLNMLENNNIVSKPTVIEPSQKNVDTLRLLEEKQEVEGQVSFLNSVIVDMQKKNEELKARVEILEMGVAPSEVDDFNLKTSKKLVAPRMFCDICDIFDAHETEDCPRQTNEDAVDPRQGEKKKTPPAQRAYCDICEMFGHATEDCDEEETY